MQHDPFDTEAQERDAKERAEKAKLALRVEREDLTWLMQSKRGRRIIKRLLERAGVWQLSFDSNALKMAFNEGRRNEGLALTAKLLEFCPEQYSLLLAEFRDE